MIEEFEYKGIWYLPERPRKRVNGILKFTPNEGAELELDGVLSTGENNKYLPRMINPDIILGVSPQGEQLTLYRCFQQRAKGVSSSSFFAHFVFVGDHFRSAEQIKFKQFYVQFSNLTEWNGISAFTTDITDNNVKILIPPIQEPILLASLRDFKMFTGIGYTSHFGVDEISLSQQAYIKFVLSKRSAFDRCSELIKTFQSFLTIAMMKPSSQISITAIKNTSTKTNSKIRSKHIKIFYSPLLSFDPKKVFAHEMLFTLRDIEGRTNQFIRNWYEKYEMLKPVYDLYFGNLYSPFSFAENRFLNLAQAIETYHRRVYGGKYQDDPSYLDGLYKTFISAIPSDLDREFRDSLVNGKFRYANEYSLRKRLTKLLQKYSSSLPIDFLDNKNERIKFIGQVVDTRNYLTHYDENAKNKVPKDTEFSILEQKLKLLVEICLLHEIGFTSEEVRLLASKSRTYKLILHWSVREES